MNASNSKTHSRVLVVGGAGYIGSHAILALDEAGYEVSVLDNLSTGFRSAVPVHMTFHMGDAGDRELLNKVLKGDRIDAIMHFAGSIVVAESVADPLKYYRNNTAVTCALIESAIRCDVRHLVFSSTAAVYGLPREVPIRESAATVPINPYGSSKLMSEWMLRDTAAVHPLTYAALRYFNVAGADPLGRAGQSTAGATHLVKVAAEYLAGRSDEVRIFGTDYDTPDGTAVRDYIHVSDLADAHVLALDRMVAGGDSLIANCGYGHGFSVREMLAAASRLAGRAIVTRTAPRRAGDPPILVADCQRIKAELGWKPRFDNLDLIIGDALKWESRVGPSPVTGPVFGKPALTRAASNDARLGALEPPQRGLLSS